MLAYSRHNRMEPHSDLGHMRLGMRRLNVFRFGLKSRVVLLLFVCLQIQNVGGAITASKRAKIERSNEHKIKRIVQRNYDKTTRPVKDDQTPVAVHIAISLYHILDTNEKEQTFTCLLAIRQKWKDEYLTWNASAFGGVKTIRMPANSIWTPDLVISNFAGDKFNDYMVTNAIVSSDGSVMWLFPALIKTYCTLNVKYFPFDTQSCQIVFISWTHSGDQLDVLFNGTVFDNAIYYKSDNQEWVVDKITAVRDAKKYACCEELYPDVTFNIHMRRGSLFYIINLIAPCFLIFLISFLGFFLPVESGEKVNLETTILLALVVFLLMVGETMPPTPDCIPILGMFFASTMVMVTIALVMAVIVTNIYAKKDTPQRCPLWTVRLASKFYPDHFLPQRNDGTTTTTTSEQNLKTSGGIVYTVGGERYYSGRTVTDPRVLRAIQDTAEVDSASPSLICCCLYHGKKCERGQEEEEIKRKNKEANKGHVTTFSCKESNRPRRRTDHSYPHHRDDKYNQAPSVSSHDSFETFDFERSEAEWRMVAKFTDRLFFWLFLAMSICTQSSLFLQMVPVTEVTSD